MEVITRFAPSPTGELHIGGARTALFNYLYSKNQKGKFLLRVEDTDKERSKNEYEKQIVSSLNWLGINFDDNIIYQSKNIDSHKKIIEELLKKNLAYKCYCKPEDLDEKREIAKKNSVPFLYDGKCRDAQERNTNESFAVRFKIAKGKKIILRDGVQGDVEIESNTLEDFIIQRSDGTPTYNLSAAVDDKNMKVTHVIRGDDHKINAFKQMLIFLSMDWKLPKYFHIPLIHSESGKKLSKRDNASTTEDYKKIGILPIALRNYLLRLGWSYKDKEVFSDEESVKMFTLKNIGKSPSKLDFERIKSLNEHYIKSLEANDLGSEFRVYIKKYKPDLQEKYLSIILKNLDILKNKAKTLEDIYTNSNFIYNFSDNININGNFINEKSNVYIKEFYDEVSKLKEFDEKKIMDISQKIISQNNIKFKDFGQPIRLVLTNASQAPSIKDIVKILGISETVQRLKNYLN